MNFISQTARALHEDHQANLDLLGRVEMAVGRSSRAALRQAAVPGSELVRLVAALERQLKQDVERHFVFEEDELFTRMTESGDGGIAHLLASEHEAIRDVTAELLPLAQAVAAGSLDDAGWATLVRGALELVERQVSHIQKEEMALLPMLDDLLDDETDRRLALEYTAA
jgi:hemerythrin-like domain-containing protein